MRCIWVMAALGMPFGAYGVPNEEVAGTEEALRWIKQVDSAEYEAAFQEMEPSIQASLKMEVWVSGLSRVRTPMGKLTKRTVKTAFFTTELPGAPSGAYIVVQFRSQFANRDKAALETITLMRAHASEWLVSGYFIQ